VIATPEATIANSRRLSGHPSSDGTTKTPLKLALERRTLIRVHRRLSLNENVGRIFPRYGFEGSKAKLG